jgi:hypothetical protein
LPASGNHPSKRYLSEPWERCYYFPVEKNERRRKVFKKEEEK